jgi:hypothetical protein
MFAKSQWAFSAASILIQMSLMKSFLVKQLQHNFFLFKKEFSGDWTEFWMEVVKLLVRMWLTFGQIIIDDICFVFYLLFIL